MLKDLNIIKQPDNLNTASDIYDLENHFHIQFPELLKTFLVKYEGAKIKERFILGEPVIKVILRVKKHEKSSSIEAILEGHIFYGDYGYIPFAIDSGGWDYNVSINPETYGQVWVDKFDSGEENPFEFVCASFEEFINGLTAEE